METCFNFDSFSVILCEIEEIFSLHCAERVCLQQTAIPAAGKSCRRCRNTQMHSLLKNVKTGPPDGSLGTEVEGFWGVRRDRGGLRVTGGQEGIGRLPLTGRSQPSSRPPRTSSGWCCAGSAGTAGPPWPSCTAASDARSRDLLWSLACL